MTKLAYQPHQIQRQQLKPLKSHIIVTDMNFEVRLSQGGIILPGDNGTTKGIRPRWARVYAVGPEQKNVQVGQWILVAHGRWTRGLDIEDEDGKHTIRRVDPKDILLISDEQMDDETFSDAIHVDKKPDHVLHS
jgi:co-chaperonin GroES (HSP10)